MTCFMTCGIHGNPRLFAMDLTPFTPSTQILGIPTVFQNFMTKGLICIILMLFQLFSAFEISMKKLLLLAVSSGLEARRVSQFCSFQMVYFPLTDTRGRPIASNKFGDLDLVHSFKTLVLLFSVKKQLRNSVLVMEYQKRRYSNVD